MLQDFYEHLDGAIYIGHNQTDGTLHVWHGSRLVDIYDANGMCVDCYGLDQFNPNKYLTFHEAFHRDMLDMHLIRTFIGEKCCE